MTDKDDYLFQLFLCVTLLILFLTFPIIAHEGAEYGLQLYIDTLLPYFLPIIILSNWLLSISNKSSSTKLSFYLKAYCLSAIGGYPTGAVILAKLVQNNAITKKETQYLLPILHFPNPLFIIGFFATDLVGQPRIGIVYLIVLHSISFLSLLVIYWKFREAPVSIMKGVYKPSLPDAIKESVQPLLLVGVTIVFFTTITSILLFLMDAIQLHSPAIQLFIIGSLEITNGLLLAHELLNMDNFLMVSILLLTTQSISIHLQVIVIASQFNLKLKQYFIMRLVFSIIISLLYFVVL